MRYDTIVGDDSFYDYQPVDTLPTVKNWIPPSQLNISSPYYPRNGSGYYSTATQSDTEPNTTEESDYEYVSEGRPNIN